MTSRFLYSHALNRPSGITRLKPKAITAAITYSTTSMAYFKTTISAISMGGLCALR